MDNGLSLFHNDYSAGSLSDLHCAWYTVPGSKAYHPLRLQSSRVSPSHINSHSPLSESLERSIYVTNIYLVYDAIGFCLEVL